MSLTFRVQILCISHSKPHLVTTLSFKSMSAVLVLFDDFGRLYQGARCAYHSSLSLIPRFAGYRVTKESK